MPLLPTSVVGLMTLTIPSAEDVSPTTALLAGTTPAAIETLDAADDTPLTRYRRALVTTVAAVENLVQNLHRYGLRSSSPRLPIARLPIPRNESPDEFTYEAGRDLLQQFIDDLAAAETALAAVDPEGVETDLVVRVDLPKVCIDFDGDGAVDEADSFGAILNTMTRQTTRQATGAESFVIAFDRADVEWFRGYTHVLRAMVETWLAYDTRELTTLAGPLFFDGASETESVLLNRAQIEGFDASSIADLIAAIHLMSFDVAEPERLSRARQHLLGMITTSRAFWRFAEAETDDDREWVPNANQTSVLRMRINAAQIEGWKDFLNEFEAVLNGEQLLPHWRLSDGYGFNLRTVFEQPARFDFVLWLHGAGMVPFVEEGNVVGRDTLRRFQQIFNGDFLSFAVWIN